MSQGARVAILAAVFAVLAGAEQASAQDRDLVLNGDQGANQIAVNLSPDGTEFLIFNSGGFHTVYGGCTQVSQSQVRCPTAGVARITSTLDEGNDTFTVGPEVMIATRVSGDGGLDTIIGGGGPDDFDGGAAADHLYGRGAADTLSGDAGKDVLGGGGGRDLLSGGLGIDILRGGKGRDTLFGGPGRDREIQ